MESSRLDLDRTIPAEVFGRSLTVRCSRYSCPPACTHALNLAGNPANVDSDQGWTVFNAVLGWNNNASIGTILAYVFYWLAVFVALVYMKWSEGRVTLFGFKSAATKRRELKAATKAEQADEQKSIDSGDEKRGAALNSSGSEGSFEEKVPVDTTAPQSTKATELV